MMEQQQIRVAFPLGTKLIVSIVALLLIVIGFLNLSTILLLTEDKRAYTYQSQATEARLAGQQVIAVVSKSFDTLRLALSLPNREAPLKNLLSNQSQVIQLSLFRFKPGTAVLQPGLSVGHDDSVQKLGLPSSALRPTENQIRELSTDLIKNGYAFYSLAHSTQNPLVGAVFADLGLKDHPDGIPIAAGTFLLSALGTDSNAGAQISIADSSGLLLYDSDPTVLFSESSATEYPLFISAIQTPLSSGAMEFNHLNTEFLGSYFKPGYGIVVMNKTPWRVAMKATYALTERFILLGLMAISASVILAIFFSKSITAPIRNLYDATKRVSSGEFDLDLEKGGRDEIGALSDSFGVMSRKISDLIQESIQKTRIESEIAIASTVQQTLFPPTDFSNPLVKIKSHYQSASECGGDWWGFFGVGNRLAVFIADATGHGIPSALITASARSCFSVLHKLAQEDPEFTFSPGSMLSYANRVVHDAASGQIMMTFFAGVIDFQERTLTFSSAGHNPPWLFRKNSSGKHDMVSLVANGTRLGEARDVAPYEEITVPIDVGDILFLYTDGITEGKNPADEMYGKKATRKIVEKSLNGGPEKIIAGVMEDFNRFASGKAPDDDITLASLMVLK